MACRKLVACDKVILCKSTLTKLVNTNALGEMVRNWVAFRNCLDTAPAKSNAVLLFRALVQGEVQREPLLYIPRSVPPQENTLLKIESGAFVSSSLAPLSTLTVFLLYEFVFSKTYKDTVTTSVLDSCHLCKR